MIRSVIKFDIIFEIIQLVTTVMAVFFLDLVRLQLIKLIAND